MAKLLNERFHAVKFNAEQTADIVFQGNTFKYVPYGQKGTHQLAAALLNNQLSYPTVVFLDADFKAAYPIPGYREAAEFHKFLMFFSEGHHKNGANAWAEFEKTYRSPYVNN